MEQKIIMVFGMVSALNAEVEAMKIANAVRLQNNDSPVYPESNFWEKAQEIRDATNELFK